MYLPGFAAGVRPSHSRSSLLRDWMTHSCHPGQELGMESSTSSPQEREQRFRDIYDAGYVDLLRFVLRRVHPTHAEDVVGDVMLVAWRRLDDVPADLSAARAWLFGVARKTLQNTRRREDRHDAVAVRLAEVRQGPADSGHQPDLVASRADIAAAWPLLSATDQEAIALAVLDGLTAPEAAAVLGISATAFRLRLSRARRTLRRRIGSTVDDPQPGRAAPERSPR